MGYARHLPKRLPIKPVPLGTRWMRIYALDKEALWFGPKPGSPGVHRFDDPDGEFRVCYLGNSIEACFAGTFLRNPPVRLLTLSDLMTRLVATVELHRELRLVALYGPGLARIGVTAEITSGAAYDHSQAWSRWIWEHADAPDGIAYHSRHDDSALCIALFDRARSAVVATSGKSLAEDPPLLAALLGRYGLGLTR
jgi:hypothetical protein